MLDAVDPFIGTEIADVGPSSGLAASWWWPKPPVGNTHPGATHPFGMVSACAYSGAYPTGYGVHDINTEGMPPRQALGVEVVHPVAGRVGARVRARRHHAERVGGTGVGVAHLRLRPPPCGGEPVGRGQIGGVGPDEWVDAIEHRKDRTNSPTPPDVGRVSRR